MQTLSAGQYNALDSKSRRPCARVYVQKNYASIPFAGKTIQATTTHEKYPFTFEHTTGIAVMLYSKYNSVTTKYDLYIKTTNTAQTLWNASVKIANSASYDYLNATAIELANTNIAIIVNQSGTLYRMIVSTAGAVVTALTTMATTGVTPTLTKVGTDYWVAYEASGVLYYKTSADFVTWSAATNLTTKTGLTNAQYNPYLYYDSNSKLWCCFERVSDPAASPVVINVYYMISTNQGSTWAASVAQTTLVAGEGSCYRPTITDTGSYRYYSYALQQQVQNLDYGAGQHQLLISDTTNDRILMITGSTAANSRLVIYDRATSLYSYHQLSSHGMLSGSVKCMDYDPVNETIVIGLATNTVNQGGFIVFNEGTSAWAKYDESTTPAISIGRHLLSLRIKNNKIYYQGLNNSLNATFGVLDLSSLTNTALATTGVGVYPSVPLDMRTFVSDSYIVFTSAPSSGTYVAHPYMRVYSATDNSYLYQTNPGYGSAYNLKHYGTAGLYAKRTYDEENDYYFSPAQDTGASDDYGIIKYQVGVAAVSFIAYYSNADSNAYGLLPNVDVANTKYTNIRVLDYSEGKLYIQSYTLTLPGEGATEFCISIFNLDTTIVESYFAPTDANDYLTNFPSIDALFNKIMLASAYVPPTLEGSFFESNENDEIIFSSSSGITYKFTILATSSDANRIYYTRTADDAAWDTAVYLTSTRGDDYLKLVILSSKLSAFWNRTIDNVSEIRWDEDLSGEIEITDSVVAFNITKNEENKSNKCTVTIEDKLRLYHPLNYSSLRYDYLAENNIIRIEKGNNGYYIPAFYGYIGSGEAEDIRGSDVLYNLEVYDRSKMFYRKKVTTSFFEGQTVEYIADYIAANYMNLDAGEYDTLPAITTVIPNVQFIEEYPMDILQKIYQPYNYFPMFDESGELIAREYNYAATVDFTYYQDGTDTVAANKVPAMNVMSFGFGWNDDDLVNQVKVIGETDTTSETIFEEEYMGSIQGVAGWFSKSQQFTFYFSEDQTLECVEPRLSIEDSCGNKFFGGGESMTFTPGSGEHGENKYVVINQNSSNLITALYALIAAALLCTVLSGFGIGITAIFNPLAPILAMVITILGQVGSYYYDIFARPVGEPLPSTIEATANDVELQTKYGAIISKEIDNPFLNTYEICLALAENELEKSSWFRYIPKIRVLSCMAHQVGDVILVYNANTGNSYKVYLTEITQSYRRGEQDVDTLTGGLII